MEPIANCDILNAYLSGHEPGDKVYQMIVSSLAEKFPPTLLQFQVLKVLCRDPSICKALFEQKDLYDRLTDLVLDTNDEAIFGEAARMLINILFNHPPARTDFAQSPRWTRVLGSLFRRENILVVIQDEADSRWFLLLRLAFLVTIDAVGAERLIQQDQLKEVGECCKVATDRLRGPQGIYAQEALELARILYNCGRFVSGDQEEIIVESVMGVLGLGKDRLEIKATAFNAFLNLKDARLVERIPDHTTILTDFFNEMIQWLGGKDDKEAIEAFPSFLLALSRILQQCPEVRQKFRRQILPGKIDRSTKPEDGQEAKSILIRLQKSTNTRLNQSIGEFFFCLVERDLMRLVFHLGYGNAAGFLFTNNLLGQMQQAIQNFSSSHMNEDQDDLSSDEEAMCDERSRGINPVTGIPFAQNTASDEMTEEEKEAEAERLIQLFDRIERTGVMKVYRPDISDRSDKSH